MRAVAFRLRFVNLPLQSDPQDHAHPARYQCHRDHERVRHVELFRRDAQGPIATCGQNATGERCVIIHVAFYAGAASAGPDVTTRPDPRQGSRGLNVSRA